MNAPQNWPQQPQQPHQAQPGHGPGPGAQAPGYGPPQGAPGYGAPQGAPGYGQPGPGYGAPGGYGPQPPKKKRTGLVVGILVAVVLLVVGGVFGSMYLEYTEDVGGGPGEEPTEVCAISDALKQQAKTSSFRLVVKPDDGKSGLKHSHCMWEQAKGKDGTNPRKLSIHVYDYRVHLKDPKKNLESAESEYASLAQFPLEGDQAKPTDGLGDQATYIKPGIGTDKTHIGLVMRKGEIVYLIDYFGRDKGFFSDSEFPADQAEAVVRKTAEEMLAK
ncbi:MULTISPECIES: hypothetical protein [unclassified Saccharothrix]|uniref:hypothetical protein n=1 Tax=unclassified Saccharothrix TaxID=2593673 RepID=UPI00307F32C2